MYTVCWVDEEGYDRWERCETMEEVEKLLKREKQEDGDDYIIFPPEADDLATFGVWAGGR